VSEPVHHKLLAACGSFLLPVSRLLLRAGISYKEFEKLSRGAFVQAAAEEFGIRGRPTNNSRIAAMTGIPRKDVSKIRAELPVEKNRLRSELSPLGDVLHHWYSDAEYIDREGKPIALQLEGDCPAFADLVKKYAGDLPAGAVRVELIRTGAVRVDKDGVLCAVRRIAVPNAIDDSLITALSFSLNCLASTVAHNSNPNRRTSRRIERFVQSDQLSERSRKKLRSLARRRIEGFTEELDDIFSAVGSEDSEQHGRVGVGVYFYEDE